VVTMQGENCVYRGHLVSLHFGRPQTLLDIVSVSVRQRDTQCGMRSAMELSVRLLPLISTDRVVASYVRTFVLGRDVCVVHFSGLVKLLRGLCGGVVGV
jgi:hypothetical protein